MVLTSLVCFLKEHVNVSGPYAGLCEAKCAALFNCMEKASYQIALCLCETEHHGIVSLKIYHIHFGGNIYIFVIVMIFNAYKVFLL